MNGFLRSGRWLRAITVLSLALSLFGFGAGAAFADDGIDGGAPGAVYTLTNAAAGNQVAIFNRAADGSLTAAGTVATGGLGSGAGLGSQGALVLSNDGRWLFAVNAGSNQISSFAVRPNGLALKNVAGSGGTMPTSLTSYGDTLYVLNAGGSGNIAGFRVDEKGMLSPIAGSTRNLSNGGVGAAPAVAQIQFDQAGRFLVVTEKSTNLIDVYAVGKNGQAGGPSTYTSNGSTPFGFAFDKRNHLIVSEAAANALSSYHLSASGALSVISPSIPSNGAAPCWVVTTKNGRYAYTTNAHSNTIAGFKVAENGRLTLLSGLANAGTSPTDMAISGNSHFLYALESGTHAIGAFMVQEDGSLVSLGTAGALPASAVGVAAR